MHFPKVELHVHLDGAIRFETILDLAQQKSIDLGVSNIDELKQKLITDEPKNLSHVLQAFHVFLPVVMGDPEAIERIAYEFCEDQAKSGVIYFEARYCPHLLCNTTTSELHDYVGSDMFMDKGKITPKTVVQSVCRGFERGQKDFKVKARQLLCCIRAHPHWTLEVLELVKQFASQGVVGIDIAGSANDGAAEVFNEEELHVFKEAKRLGIRRTVHAGENGTADDVDFALKRLFAERIGHGYRVLQDQKVYDEAKSLGYHFEVCPLSSIITGSVTDYWDNHPAVQFQKDGVNFSLNTDDPTCFGNSYKDELLLVKDKLGFTDEQIWQCQLNAAKSCFLPDEEKKELVEIIRNARPQ